MSTLGSESAFPVPDVPVGDVSGNWLSHYRATSDGVSTRLYLAAKAMEGLLAGGARTSGLAPVAFSIADDMLAVLYAPGRLERVSDDLKDLKSAVAALLPFLMKMEEAKEAVEVFCPKSAPHEFACLRVHEIMARLPST
jgi:hypothetical protein